MNQQIFSDGIGAIAIVGGVVRIDLIVYSPTEKDSAGQPKPVFQQQVVMSGEAFLRASEKMQGAAQAFAKITPRPPEPRATAQPPAEPAPAAALTQPVERPFP